MLSYHMWLVASALEKQQWRFNHCTKFSWIELLWREYLVLCSWGGLYHLGWLIPFGFFGFMGPNFMPLSHMHMTLVLPPNSKDPSSRVHFRAVKQVYTSSAVELFPGIQRLTLWVRTHGKINSWQYVSRRVQKASPTLLTSSTTNCTCTFLYPVEHRPLCGLKWWEWSQPRWVATKSWLVTLQQRAGSPVTGTRREAAPLSHTHCPWFNLSRPAITSQDGSFHSLTETPCHFALFPRPLAQHLTYIDQAENGRKACYQVFAASAAFAEVTSCLPHCFWNLQWQHIKKQLDSPSSNKPSLTALLIFLWGAGFWDISLCSPVCRPGCPQT